MKEQVPLAICAALGGGNIDVVDMLLEDGRIYLGVETGAMEWACSQYDPDYAYRMLELPTVGITAFACLIACYRPTDDLLQAIVSHPKAKPAALIPPVCFASQPKALLALLSHPSYEGELPYQEIVDAAAQYGSEETLHLMMTDARFSHCLFPPDGARTQEAIRRRAELAHLVACNSREWRELCPLTSPPSPTKQRNSV